MKRLAVIAVVICLAAISSAEEDKDLHKPGRHGHPGYATVNNPVPGTVESVAEGDGLFKKHCAVCHGDEGKGKTGPALTAPVLRHGRTDGEIFNIVTGGVPGTAMPVFGEALTEEKRWHVVNYIQGLRKKFHDEGALTLEDLERRALKNNPTLLQAAADIASAEGRRIQAGLYPNPVVGYLGEDISARAPGRSKHFLFWEQEFVTAGKLQHRRSIFAREKDRAELERLSQTQRVLNDVRSLYYQSLGAERLVELHSELVKITREAVEISDELFNIGQADRPDLLAVEIEAEKAELALEEAENRQEQTWRALAAVVGDPVLKRSRLAGGLDEEIMELGGEAMLNKLLKEGPQVSIAESRIERARAALESARSRRVPNITVRLGLGYNFEEIDGDKRVGPEGNLELAVPFPMFDRNQGNIAAAEGELLRAEQELRRLELSLRASFAVLFSGYSSSAKKVTKYRTEILPRAKMAHDLYLERSRQMAASYPQVLIARRAYFQAQADYVEALMELRQKAIAIQGSLLTGGLGPQDRQTVPVFGATGAEAERFER